jgi:hypothetical protein
MAGSIAKADRFDIFRMIRTIFEPQLIALGLSSEQIERQEREELEQSLERVNESIRHPNSFGTLRLAADSEGGWYVAKGASDANIQEVNILPLLLERKKLILERLKSTRINEEILEAQNIVKNSDAAEISEEEKHQREKLIADLKKEQGQLKENAEAQKEEELKAKLALADLQVRAEIEMKKAKARSEIWQSFLVRESVATIVGGCLLILITVVLLIAIFFKLTAPDIINNSFLVILGYFFGQAANSILPDAKTKGGRSSQKDEASHES